jgi:hypothetical protein
LSAKRKKQGGGKEAGGCGCKTAGGGWWDYGLEGIGRRLGLLGLASWLGSLPFFYLKHFLLLFFCLFQNLVKIVFRPENLV